MGDRRDHFESIKDVWEIFRVVAEERKRREIDPTLRAINECLVELKKSDAHSVYTRERLEEMLGFLSTASGLFEELVRIPNRSLKNLTRLHGKLTALLGIGKKEVKGEL